MDWLLEMIVNAIVSAIRKRSALPGAKPPAQRAQARPQAPPAKPNSPPLARRRRGAQPIARRAVAGPVAQKPPTIDSTPRPFAVKLPPKSAPPPPPAAASLSAATIRQLVQSRPAALRSIYVLTEVLQPPLALRRESVNP